MNILSRIFSNKAPVAQVPAPVSTPTPSAPLAPFTSSALDLKMDSWEKKFSAPPYFENSRLMPSGFYCGNPPRLSQEILRAVFDRAGGDAIFSKSDLAKLTDLRNQQDAIAARLDDLAFTKIGQIFRQQRVDASAQLLSGKPTGQLVGYQAATDAVVQGREACHLVNADLAAKIYEIVAPACAKMKLAARALADELNDKETAAHGKFFPKATGIPFKPSELLRTFIYVALTQADVPVRNFHLTKLIQAPAMDKGVFSLWWNEAPAPVTVPIERLRDENRNRAVEDNRHAVTQRTKEELAAKNAFVEKIKAAGAKALAEKQQADATREAENENRKMQAMDKLHRQQQTNQ